MSVLDVRSSKPTPFAQSEDQEDELLSAVTIKGLVNLVRDIPSISKPFKWAENRGRNSNGHSFDFQPEKWLERLCRSCSRVRGVLSLELHLLKLTNALRHPHSIDTLCTLPSSYPSSHSTILTGSSDGLIRVVQLLPTKLLGIVADHGDFPVERIVVDRAGEGRWVGSVGHEDILKLTDLKDIFEDEDEGGIEMEEKGHVRSEGVGPSVTIPDLVGEEKEVEDPESEEPEPEEPKPKKRKMKQAKDPLAKKREKKVRNQIVTDPSFFSGL